MVLFGNSHCENAQFVSPEQICNEHGIVKRIGVKISFNHLAYHAATVFEALLN